MTRRSIALVGKLGSGKSTVAGMLEEYGYRRHSWAAGVRDVFSMAYDPITPENYGRIKETVYTVQTRNGPVERTGRELLQRIGTEAMRDAIDRDFWIKAGLRRANRLGQPVVNDDTRFLNEASALHELGFLIVRVIRPGIGDTGSHPSEVEQDVIDADATLVNDGTLDQLRRRVDGLVSNRECQDGCPV